MLIILITSLDDVGFGRALILLLAVQISGSIKRGAAFHNECTEQKAIKTEGTWQLPHANGCVTEYRESHRSKMKQ